MQSATNLTTTVLFLRKNNGVGSREQEIPSRRDEGYRQDDNEERSQDISCSAGPESKQLRMDLRNGQLQERGHPEKELRGTTLLHRGG